MKVLLTADAFKDLKNIYDYISDSDSIENANYVLDNIKEKTESLNEFPNRGTYVKELQTIGDKTYREIFFKPYRIIYKVANDTVYIMLVADGRRDMAALLERRMLD